MRPLRPGQDTVLSWTAGAIDCRVVAAAGAYVLLRPERASAVHELPEASCSLTFLDGMIPMGWDGVVEFSSEPGELRFHVSGGRPAADRRSSVRLPIYANVAVSVEDTIQEGQVLDVSAGGMRLRVETEERVELHTTVHIRCELPGGGPLVDTDAIVRASEPGMIAVEFAGLAAAEAQAVGRWTVGQLRNSLAGRG